MKYTSPLLLLLARRNSHAIVQEQRRRQGERERGGSTQEEKGSREIGGGKGEKLIGRSGSSDFGGEFIEGTIIRERCYNMKQYLYHQTL
jgi:hypothetical protein